MAQEQPKVKFGDTFTLYSSKKITIDNTLTITLDFEQWESILDPQFDKDDNPLLDDNGNHIMLESHDVSYTILAESKDWKEKISFYASSLDAEKNLIIDIHEYQIIILSEVFNYNRDSEVVLKIIKTSKG